MIKKPFMKRLRLDELLPIFIISAIPLLWYNPSGVLIGGVDFDTPLEPIRRFLERKFTWSTLYLGGNDRSMDIPGGFVFIGIQAFFKLLGFGLLNVQKLSFIFWFGLTGISMYIMMSLLVKGDTVKDKIIRISATIFYMVNFYQLHIWMIARIGELSGAILIPVSLGLLIKGLEGKISLNKCLLISAIFFLFGSGIGVQPPVLGVFFIVLVSYFIYHLLLSVTKVIKKRRIFKNLVFFIGFLFFFFLINAFWIIPITNFIIQSNYASGSFENMDAIFNLRGLLEATSGRTNSFLNIIRLYGDNVWFGGYKGIPYLPFFTEYLNNPFLILLSFLFPLLAYTALIFYKRNYRYTIFFVLLVLIATFVSKGIYKPFGELFFWVFKNIPGFWVYRAPWQKFGLLMMISYAFLAGLTTGYIYEFLQSKINRSLSRKFIRFLPMSAIIFIVGMHLVYHYGFIFGRMLPTTEERKVLPGFHQNYPQYLFNSAKWINTQPTQFNIMLLPDDKANAYYWGYGGASDISLKLFNKGIIFRQYGEGMAPPNSVDKLYNILINSLYSGNFPYTGKIAGLLNVRYFLHRKDFIYDWSGDTDSVEFVENRLKKQKGIKLQKSIGEWNFYRNKYEFSHIYIPDDIIYVEGDLNILPALSFKGEFRPGVAILFSSDLEEENKKFISSANYQVISSKGELELIKVRNNVSKIPAIEIDRINPTKYIIRVKDASEPFWLVFSESFHNQWKIYELESNKVESIKLGVKSDKVKYQFGEIIAEHKDLETKKARYLMNFTPQDIKYLWGKPLDVKHQLINGYANGWYIEPGKLKLGEDFTLGIYFLPQSLFYLGLGISGLTLLAYIFHLVCSGLEKRKKR